MTTAAGLLAAGLACVAVLLLRPVAVRPQPTSGGQGPPRAGWSPTGGAAVCGSHGVLVGGLVVGTTFGVAVAAGAGRRAVLLAVVVALALAAVLATRRRRERQAVDARRDRVLAAAEGLVADLRAGQPPTRALERAARGWPELDRVVAAAHVDADVPDALRTLGRAPGGGDLRAVAAAWQVAHETGSGLAPALAVTVASLRQRRRTARLVGAEVAAARATARLLAALPLGVLALGSSLGGDPVGFLLDTVAGLACLVLGLALCGAGWWWLERIAEGVLEQ